MKLLKKEKKKKTKKPFQKRDSGVFVSFHWGQDRREGRKLSRVFHTGRNRERLEMGTASGKARGSRWVGAPPPRGGAGRARCRPMRSEKFA